MNSPPEDDPESGSEPSSSDGIGEESVPSSSGEVVTPPSEIETNPTVLNHEALANMIRAVSSLNELDSILSQGGKKNGVLPLPDVDYPKRPRLPYPDRFRQIKLEGVGDSEGVLGEGATSCVYTVRDLQTNEAVAMKVLRITEAGGLFKKECELAKQLSHPNLATIYEYLNDGRSVGMTMRLIKGQRLTEWIEAHEIDRSERELIPERIKDALSQIYHGLVALHAVGFLHQDLKPDNIYIDEEGHLYILDFGLVVRSEDDRTGLPDHAKQLPGGGTWPFMSPEQHRVDELDPKSDWYSVGVILYRLLTGRLPFKDLHDTDELLRLKEAEKYPLIREFSHPWLNEAASLCQGLLTPTAEERFGKEEVAEFLGIAPDEDAFIRPRQGLEMIGRSHELRLLDGAFDVATRETAPMDGKGSRKLTICQIRGGSGQGKSFLIENYVGQLETGEKTIVLAGKCDEHRKTPCNAIEPLMDQLAGYLSRSVSFAQLSYRLERFSAAGPLTRMFPDLVTIPGFREASARPELGKLPLHELRRKALAGIPQLLERISERHQLVLIMDDIQWADELSLEALDWLLKAKPGRGILLITVEKTEDLEGTNEASLGELISKHQDRVHTVNIDVKPLDSGASRELAQRLKGPKNIDLEKIVEASKGHPQILSELVCSQHDGSRTEDVFEIFWERFSNLPAGQQNLVSVLTISGQPLPKDVAFEAAGIAADGKAQIESELIRLQRLMRTCGTIERNIIDISHGRVRQSILDRMLPDDQAKWHLNLATSYEASSSATGELLAIHFEKAGADYHDRAGENYERAGEEAMAKLAFPPAAGYFEKSIILRAGLSDHQKSQIFAKQANALTHAGNGRAAGLCYQKAAHLSPNGNRDAFFHKSTEQFLISGNLNQAIEGLESLLAAAELWVMGPRMAAVRTEVRRLICFRRKTLKFKTKSDAECDPKELDQIDRGWTLVLGFGFREVMLAGEFQNQGLLRAQKAGCPKRFMRALSMEAWYQSALGRRRGKLVSGYLKQARELNDDIGDPYASGIIELAEGTSSWLLGHFKAGSQHTKESTKIFRKSVPGHFWEPDTGLSYRLFALVNLGEFSKVREICEREMPAAKARGDRYLETNQGCYPMPMALIAGDEPVAAAEMARTFIDEWTKDQGFQVNHQQAQHLLAWVSQIESALYLRDAEKAMRILDEGWEGYKKSMLHLVQHCRIQALYCRGRIFALKAQQSEGKARTKNLNQAKLCARKLRREYKRDWAKGLGESIVASLAAMEGKDEEAASLMQKAAMYLYQGEAFVQSAAVEYELARRTEDSVGEGRAAAWMTKNGVKCPDKYARLIVI